MRKIAIVTLALLLAAPAVADFAADATNLTWSTTRPTTIATQYRDALLWYFDATRIGPVDGLVAVAARPQVTLVDVGGGNSLFSVALPLAAGNAWVTALAAGPCPTANTATLRRACADDLIKREMKLILTRHLQFIRDQTSPVPPTPDP